MKLKYILPFFLLSFFVKLPNAFAHGTDVEYRNVQAVQIQANFDGGQPMENAQVTVYSPEDPASPWTTGTTDEEGYFTFTPDVSQPGNWEVKVRQAGHGDIITIPVESAQVEKSAMFFGQTAWSSENENPTSVEKVLLGFAGVWGFFGTALFFARKKDD